MYAILIKRNHNLEYLQNAYKFYCIFLKDNCDKMSVKKKSFRRPQYTDKLLCAPVHEPLVLAQHFFVEIMILNFYISYENFIMFLEVQLLQNVLKRNFDHGRQ